MGGGKNTKVNIKSTRVQATIMLWILRDTLTCNCPQTNRAMDWDSVAAFLLEVVLYLEIRCRDWAADWPLSSVLGCFHL